MFIVKATAMYSLGNWMWASMWLSGIDVLGWYTRAIIVKSRQNTNALRSVVGCVNSSADTTPNEVISANDTAEPPVVEPPTAPLYPNITTTTDSDFNDTEAERICQAPILESFIYSLCENFTLDILPMITSSCVRYLQVIQDH